MLTFGFAFVCIFASYFHIVHKGSVAADQFAIVKSDMCEFMEQGEPKTIDTIMPQCKIL